MKTMQKIWIIICYKLFHKNLTKNLKSISSFNLYLQNLYEFIIKIYSLKIWIDKDKQRYKDHFIKEYLLIRLNSQKFIKLRIFILKLYRRKSSRILIKIWSKVKLSSLILIRLKVIRIWTPSRLIRMKWVSWI